MSISSGYDKFKDYHQTDDGSYKLTSRWTSSNTVELDDGTTVEEKFAEIDSELNDVADNKVDKVSGKGLSTNDYTTTEKNKLAGIASGAEVNQNAFSSVKVGSTTVAADSKTDTLTLEGSNVTLTPDTTNDKVTIGITKENVTAALGYTPPTKDTTYGVATSSTPGLVKSGTDITVDSSGNVSVNDDSHNHVISNVDGLQGELDAINSSLENKHLKTYTSWTQLGITDISTWTSWVGVLPAGSMLITPVWMASASQLHTNGIIPYDNGGTLQAINDGGRGIAAYYTGNRAWFGRSDNLDANTFIWYEVAVASRYLPLTGGTLSGDLIRSADDASEVRLRVKNSLIDGGMIANASGLFGLYDYSHARWVLKSDGVNTGFYGNCDRIGTSFVDPNTLTIRNYVGESDVTSGRHMFVQANFANNCVNIGINGHGACGVNNSRSLGGVAAANYLQKSAFSYSNGTLTITI